MPKPEKIDIIEARILLDTARRFFQAGLTDDPGAILPSHDMIQGALYALRWASGGDYDDTFENFLQALRLIQGQLRAGTPLTASRV